MEGDMNYYQPSYHQSSGQSAMKHSAPGPADAYPRARQIPVGSVPSSAPLSHHQPYSSDTVSYGSRTPATGQQPLRKTMDTISTSVASGLPPSLHREYFNERNIPYDDKKMHTASRLMPTESAVSQQQHSSISGYPNRAAYLHGEAASHQPKYEMHGSGSTGGRVHGGYPNEDISVSKVSSYPAGGAPGGMPHSSRDLASINVYERDYVREHEPQARERSIVPAVSSLEKYFSSEEIKQFSDYNRFLAMSTPIQQKKFYDSLTTAEYNRFRDFVDFERNNKPSASFKAALPPPIPSAASLPAPTPYDNHSSVYPSSYSFASSFYEEDKMSTGSGGHRPPIHHLKSKYSTSGSPPPPLAPFVKGISSYQTFPESSYERFLSTRDLSTGMSRYADMSMRLGRDLRDTLPLEDSLGHKRSARPGYRLSRSRSRSITPENRSRSSRFRHGSPSRREEHPKHRKGYLPRELHADSHSYSRSHSRRSQSQSPGPRDRKRSRKSLSKDRKETSDGRDHNKNSANQHTSRKLAPKEEHYYLLDSLTKVKKIHKVKLEELEEIKNKDDGKCDSYIYKKVASSVKDIEERIAKVERQLEANRIVLGDSFPEVEKSYEEKEKEKITSLKALRKIETKSKTVSDAKVSNDEPSEKKENELSKDASSSSIASAVSAIEATAETVAKLPKIPKLSAKKSAKINDSDSETKAEKKTTDEPVSNESASIKNFSSKEEVKIGFLKSSNAEPNVEPSSSNKSESKEPSKSTSASYSGPITEDEIEQILPFYQYCSLCKNFFESTDEFITHLHRDAHLNGLRTSDFLIIKRAEEKLDSQMLNAEQASVAAMNGSDKAPVFETNVPETLGSEFLYPCKAFYCDLCAKFLYTTQQTELHLSSEKHVTLYKKYLQKNKEYSSKMITQRKNEFKYSYLLRTLIRMKDKGEDIVNRVSQEMVRQTRAKKEHKKNEREKGKSSESVDKETVVESPNAETDTKKMNIKEENNDEEDTMRTDSKDMAKEAENSVDQSKMKNENVDVSVKQEENEDGSASGQNEEENEDNDENGENEEDSPETLGEGDNDDLENVNLEEEDYEEIMDINTTNGGFLDMNMIENMNILGDEVDKFLSEQQAANGNIAQQVSNIMQQEENEDTEEEEEENVAGQNEEEEGRFDVIDEA